MNKANANPLLNIQDEYQKSNHEFSLLLGVDKATLLDAKRGRPVNPRAILRGLSELGHDAAAFFEQYTQWRNEARRRLIKSTNKADA